MVQSERHIIKQKFDDEQPHWEEMYHRKDYDSKGFQWRKDSAVTLCSNHLPRGSWILDLGCGCGNASLTLAQLGFRVSGADISESMIAQAITNAKQLRLNNCHFQIYDVAREHPDAGHFDAVIALGFIEYFDDPIWVLRKMRQLVTQDGLVVVQIWNRKPWAGTLLSPPYRFCSVVAHPLDSLKGLAKTILPRTLVQRLQRTPTARRARIEPLHRRYTPRELHRLAQGAGFELIGARASRYFPYRFFFSEQRRIKWDEQLQRWSGDKPFVQHGAIDYVAAFRRRETNQQEEDEHNRQK